MSLTPRWLSRDSADLIGTVRMHCYAGALNQLPQFTNSVLEDSRVRDGQFLIVEKDRKAVGTAASADLTMNLAGALFPTQGVAYVGTIRTERRKGSGKAGPKGGIATAVMTETLAKARDNGQALSALMPFRTSFYEHFGFGLVERQNNWTIPLSICPNTDAGNWSAYTPNHLDHLLKLRNEIATQRNCDIERPRDRWQAMIAAQDTGFIFVEEGAGGEAWVMLKTEPEWTLRVTDWGAKSPGALKRLLAFLGSLRDQYARVHLTAPVDLPLNLLLKEPQVPHRPVAHPTAILNTITRMQVRVLDHQKVLNAIHWPSHAKGAATISIQESEGHESRLKLDIEAGRSSATPTTQTPTFTTTDKTWASILAGELCPLTATHFNLASGDPTPLLPLTHTAKPFTWEYF